jgi:hypothetical protein
MEFSEWITKKYIDWRGASIGNDRSITQFAAYLDVSQSLLTQWMKKGGKVPRSSKTISALVNRFGDEVYEILGYAKPGYEQVDISSLPEGLRGNFRSAMAEIERELKLNELDPESPEAGKVIRASFEKFGFTVTTKR